LKKIECQHHNQNRTLELNAHNKSLHLTFFRFAPKCRWTQSFFVFPHHTIFYRMIYT